MQITVDTRRATAAIRGLDKQLRFAAGRTVNRLALESKAIVERVLPQRLDRPTPYTQNSLRVEFARRGELTAILGFRPDAPGARSAARYLQPNIEGGPRPRRAIENALVRAGIMPPAYYLVPADGAQLDAYGNWRRSQITAVLADLQAAITPAARRRIEARAKRAAASTRAPRASRYFVLRQQEGELEPGIYERRRLFGASAVRPVALFTRRQPLYRARLPFRQIAERVVQQRAGDVFAAELAGALQTAR